MRTFRQRRPTPCLEYDVRTRTWVGAGVSFRIAVQTQQKATLPEAHWAFYEDPTAAAIEAAQAPPAQYSQAPPAASAQHRSASGGNTAPLGSLQSPYAEPQAEAQHGTQSTAAATGAASQAEANIDHPFAPSDASPHATPRRASLGDGHSSPPAGAPSIERMHEVGFGSGGGARGGLQPPPWDSQQSQGVQSQTQRPDQEQASNSTQRPAENLRHSQAAAGRSEVETPDRHGNKAGVAPRQSIPAFCSRGFVFWGKVACAVFDPGISACFTHHECVLSYECVLA